MVVFMSWIINREEWLAIYNSIKERLSSLSFNNDQEATDLLSKILVSRGNSITVGELFNRVKNKNRAVIVGCGRNIYYEVEVLKKILERENSILIVSANGATRILIENNIKPDLITTDLDGDLDSLVRASSEGSIIVIHAHGDNIDRLKYIEYFKGPIIGSTQVEPRPLVYNFGGFTDGDRAIYILYHIGYRKVYLVGFDFEEPYNCPGKENKDLSIKKIKLEIAKNLVKILIDKGLEVLSISEL